MSLISGAEFLPERVLNKFYSNKPFALTHRQKFLKEQCESSSDEAPHSTACEPHDAREQRANTGNNSSHCNSSGFSSSTFSNSSFANRGREILAALQSKNTRANCSSSESTCSKLRVSITDTTTHGEGLQAHTVYIILVKDEASGLEWHTHRRYSQFERLHNQIALLHPDAVLPKKELFSRHRGVVELRIQALNEYLQQLLRAPQIRNHEALRSFLEVSPLQRG
jgi:PX domain